jgi:hypothetical protein
MYHGYLAGDQVNVDRNVSYQKKQHTPDYGVVFKPSAFLQVSAMAGI